LGQVKKISLRKEDAMCRFTIKKLRLFLPLLLVIILLLSYTCKNEDGDDENNGDITIQRFGGPGTENGKFGNSPRGITIGTDGHVYVSDTANNRVQKFTANGVYERKWNCSQPYGLVVNMDWVYVCSVPSKIEIFLLDGTPYDSWNIPDINDRSGGMAVVDIDVDANGMFYILDNIDRAVKKFNSSGVFMGSFRVDTVDNLTWGPLGIAVVSDQVFVTDAANHKVNVWNVNGTFIRSIGSQGSQNGQFYAPTGIAVMNSTTIIVGDINLAPTFARIQSFSLNGTFRNVIKPDNGSFYPAALAVNPAGSKIYICYSGTFEIRVVDSF